MSRRYHLTAFSSLCFTKPPPWTRTLSEWAASLAPRIAEFRSTYAPVSEAEDLDLRSSEAVLAIAERRFADVARALDIHAEPRAPGDSATRDRGVEILRLRTDASFDTGDWSAALEDYRRVAHRSSFVSSSELSVTVDHGEERELRR